MNPPTKAEQEEGKESLKAPTPQPSPSPLMMLKKEGGEEEDVVTFKQQQESMNNMKKQTDDMMRRLLEMQAAQQAVQERQEQEKKSSSSSPIKAGGGVTKMGSLTNAAKSEKRRRNEIRKRIDVLRSMLPDSVRNKNVIEVLDDTILLVNNLKSMLETSQMATGGNPYGQAANLSNSNFQNNVQTLLQQSSQNAQSIHQQRLGEAQVLRSLQQDQESGRTKHLMTILQEQQQQQQQQQAVNQLLLNNQAAASAGFIQQQASMQGQATFAFNMSTDPGTGSSQKALRDFLRDN